MSDQPRRYIRKKRKKRRFKQGTYEVVNRDKYVGKENPKYRSSWELVVFQYLDHHSAVLAWGSENVIVKYYDPVRERQRRYMVDLYFKVKDRDGNIVEYIAEVKPAAQCVAPKKTPRKRQDVYESEVMTFTTNQCKWEAAKKYAAVRGWKFIILTEHSIFKKGKPPN